MSPEDLPRTPPLRLAHRARVRREGVRGPRERSGAAPLVALQDIQLFGFGAAAVVDTAVLLMLFERRNWRRVVIPVLMFVLGAWLYHLGTFVHTLVYVGGAWSEGPLPLRSSRSTQDRVERFIKLSLT